MKRDFYQTPDVRIMSVYNEGILCSSEEESNDPMLLPGTEWKQETIW